MIAFFARHPTAANLLMIVFLAVGVLSLGRLRRETFPDFRPTEVEVRIVYRGATAEEVEEAVCQRVEDALDRVRFVKELRSDARDGLAIVTVRMEPEGKYQAFKDEIDTAVAAIDDFPPEVEEPAITQLHTTDLVLSILVAGPLPLTDLKAYCEDFKERLQQQPEVSLVQIRGFSTRQLRIELSDEALRRYGLNAAEVADIVGRQSVNLPAGVIQSPDGELTVRFVDQRRSPRELEDLVIVAGPGGAEIRLGDLGRVRDLFEPEEEQVLFGGRRAGLLNIEMTRNQDVIRVADVVKRFIDAERERHPQLDFSVTRDTSILVRDRLKLLVTNGWQGMLLVFVTLWLFFHLRLSFWVVMSLPVSFLGALFVMPYLGLTINMMTMVGLLLALGILMDDGIVIAENIATHRALGKPPLQAAVDGVREVQAGVFSSFITTVCVLGPLAFLAGDIGKVLQVVPLVLILVLVVSLIEAFCILPAHLGHALHQGGGSGERGLRRHVDWLIDGVRERLVGCTVDALLRWRYLWIGTVIGVFVVSLSLIAGGIVKFQAFPDLDGDVIEARLVLAPGTPLARTQDVVRRMTDALERVNERFAPLQPDGRALVETVYVQLNQNAEAFENGPHVATVTADLLTAEHRKTVLDDVFRAWREEAGSLPDMVSMAYTEPGFGPQGRSLEIRLQGNDLQELKAGGDRVATVARRIRRCPQPGGRSPRGQTRTSDPFAPRGIRIGVGRRSHGPAIAIGIPRRDRRRDSSGPRVLRDRRAIPPRGSRQPGRLGGVSLHLAPGRSRAAGLGGRGRNSTRLVPDCPSRPLADGDAARGYRRPADQHHAAGRPTPQPLFPRFSTPTPRDRRDVRGRAQGRRHDPAVHPPRDVDRAVGRVHLAQFPVSQLRRAADRDGRHPAGLDRRGGGTPADADQSQHAQRARLRLAGWHCCQRLAAAGPVLEDGEATGRRRPGICRPSQSPAVSCHYSHLVDHDRRPVAAARRAEFASTGPDSAGHQHHLWLDGLDRPGPAGDPLPVRDS